MGQAAAAKAEIKRRSDEAARVEQEKKESTVKGQTEKVKTAIQQHMADNADEMVDLVDAFLKLTPEQQAHAAPAGVLRAQPQPHHGRLLEDQRGARARGQRGA